MTITHFDAVKFVLSPMLADELAYKATAQRVRPFCPIFVRALWSRNTFYTSIVTTLGSATLYHYSSSSCFATLTVLSSICLASSIYFIYVDAIELMNAQRMGIVDLSQRKFRL